MRYNRTAAVATAFVTAVAFPVLTAAGASARVAIPWTEETVFALSPTDSYIAEWMGLSSGWTIIGGPASRIYAGSAGVFAIDPSTGDISEYDGTPGEWTVIGGTPGPSPMAESRTNLFGVTDDSNGRVATVDVYSGSGTSWTVIGGPADPRLAAGD